MFLIDWHANRIAIGNEWSFFICLTLWREECKIGYRAYLICREGIESCIVPIIGCTHAHVIILRFFSERIIFVCPRSIESHRTLIIIIERNKRTGTVDYYLCIGKYWNTSKISEIHKLLFSRFVEEIDISGFYPYLSIREEFVIRIVIQEECFIGRFSFS